jgi:hypothetical protein
VNNLKMMLEQKGLHLLDLATANYLPGHLVKIHYFWRFGDFRAEIRLDEDRGLATRVLQVPALALTPRGPSDIVIQNVTDQFEISAGSGLPQFGLTASGDIKNGVTVTFNISPVETISFGGADVQTYFSTILPDLRKFADSDPRANGWIKECLVIKQVFFAQTVSGTVHTAGNIDGKAAFAQAGIAASSNLSMSWSDDNATFVVQGTNLVPFAARGDVVG